METKNKQWVCHPSAPLHSHGQVGPEDLSSNRNGQNRSTDTTDRQDSTDADELQGISNIYNKNGLDHFLAQQVEDNICENRRQAILQLLEEITRLTSTEKLLLYLKLPTDLINVSDPLRQPLNPLGSRTEISQTIMWIRTHLEEDPELSLPKQEVYNEYTVHCANNKMKPLSTADFGKVMKQVYPSVRPRRLGTRGNSRYCYAGLRKRFKLEVPQLPDLDDRPQSTEPTGQTPSELTAAAWLIVRKWAEDILGTPFLNVCSLALYLVKNVCPLTVPHCAAATLICTMDAEGSNKSDSIELPAQSSIGILKHKEAQFQLQRKLQQREVTREQKRKLQLQMPVSKTVEAGGKVSGGKCKKSKISPTSTETQPALTLDVCDKSNECVTLPNFSSFQLKKPLDTPELKPSKEQLRSTQKPTSAQVSRSNSQENESFDTNQVTSDTVTPELKPNIAGKLPIPRLPSSKGKPVLAPPKSVIFPPPKKCSRSQQKYKAIQPKPLTKCDTQYAQQSTNAVEGDITTLAEDQLKDIDYLTRERLISVSNVDKDALDDYLHGGNNSQEQEEELMQYFKNNGASAETLNDGVTQSDTVSGTVEDQNNGSKSDQAKLSQLRLLLEQNLNQQSSTQMAPGLPLKNIFVKTSEKPSFMHSSNATALHSGTKRRVSFETSVLENETVPPSPNTRRKNFSFTPISPGPHSPGGRQSKSSSTNASPFVSPRNTPVPRAKTSSHIQSGATSSFVAQQTVISSRKHIKPSLKASILKHESDLFCETQGDQSIDQRKHFINPIDVMAKCNLPMSAPPSPMLPYKQKTANQNSNLLQKLLDSNSKVSYIPDYDKTIPSNPLSQEVSQLMGNSSQCFPTTLGSYRSQSVPLHQMVTFKTLMSPCIPNTQPTQFNFNFEGNSVAPTPSTNEFSDFETFPDSDILNNGLNQENLSQIFNILDTTQSAQMEESNVGQNENIFNFSTETDVIPAEMQTFNPLSTEIHQSVVQKPIRSQSIDDQIDADLRTMCSQKFGQISRSVPNTPLSYKSKQKSIELNLNNNQMGDLFDCTKPLNVQQDYLLNGHPVIKKKFIFDNEMEGNDTFPSSLGFMVNDTSMGEGKLCFGANKIGDGSFGARRNLNSLLDQQFPETDEYTAVPNLNSGTS